VFVGENYRNWIIMHGMENTNLKLFMNHTDVLHHGMSGTLVEHILAWYFAFLVAVLNKASTDHVNYSASNNGNSLPIFKLVTASKQWEELSWLKDEK
jgi:hypothetical protein